MSTIIKLPSGQLDNSDRAVLMTPPFDLSILTFLPPDERKGTSKRNGPDPTKGRIVQTQE